MKPTTEQILSALNEMLQSKTELKAEKVELGLLDDAKKLTQTSKKLVDSIKVNEKIYKRIFKDSIR